MTSEGKLLTTNEELAEVDPAEETIERVTERLSAHYRRWKDGETDKNIEKDKFFALAVEAQEERAEKLVTMIAPMTDEATVIERFEKANPTWIVEAVRHIEPYTWEAILIEDPAYMPFTYLNRNIGMVFQKQVSAGSVYVDDERLLQDRPELWLKVTEVPNRAALLNIIYECGVDNEECDERLDESFPLEARVLRPLESLDPDDLAELSRDFIYQGKPTIKLAAPRKAKAEELE